MRTPISAAVALALALTLTGCGAGISEPPQGDEDREVITPVVPEETAEPEPEPEPEPEAPVDGTRDNPIPFGQVTYIEEVATSTPMWEIRVDPWYDGTEAIRAENQFNDPPAQGNIYLAIPVNIVWQGTEPVQPWLDWEYGIEVAYVGADGVTAEQEFVVQPWPALSDIADMYQGAAADFVAVVSVPAATDGLVRVTAGGFDFFVGPASK